MKLEFQEYLPKKIVNVHKHVDGGWFWTKCSAHPYIGCRSGCEFCYLRGGINLGKRDPQIFDTHIKVKLNSAELLRKELARLTPDVINAGDWQQPAEDRYLLSREMLKIVAEFSFPLFVVERSPLLLRDLDLLEEINHISWSCVAYSISNLDPNLKRAFEPRSPGVQRRLDSMRILSNSGILFGLSLMPIIPFLGDDRAQIEELIIAARDHGAKFVLAGGMTMDGEQAERTLVAAGSISPDVELRWRELYNQKQQPNSSANPSGEYAIRLGNMVRELAEKHGIMDQIPRYIADGPLAMNKLLAEKLFVKVRDLELEAANQQRIWRFRKAAWTVDELETSIADIYLSKGESGLGTLPSIGKNMASQIASWLTSHKVNLTHKE